MLADLQTDYKREGEKLLENIKRLCAEQGINIRQLEEKAGVAYGTIGRWGKGGKLFPSIEKVKKVADALGVTMDEIYREEAEDGISED